MRMVDIINKKKRAETLSTDEINFFTQNYNKGKIPDYQVSALMMAIVFQKMNIKETSDLTMAMVKSGDVLDLSSIDGIKVDKHSTGGVGDKTTLVLAPLVAAAKVHIAKMSGRGLGHTGGTIDKLNSFKGFSTDISEEEFIDNVKKHYISIMSPTKDIAPADKKLYALRDVTGTVENVSLIASSIMSKKIASGADKIVLDVKTGSGAFMKDYDDALVLAETMVNIGKQINREVVAVISDMDQPLGYAIGNVLEVKEAVETLKGNGPEDLLKLCLTLGSNMLVLAGKSKNTDEAEMLLKKLIENGEAFKKFKEFISIQGGNPIDADNLENLPKTKYIYEVKSKISGYVNRIDSYKIGIASMVLGAGRASKDDDIDLSVGIVLNKKRNDKVDNDETLCYIYSNDEEKTHEVERLIIESFAIEDKKTDDVPLIYKVIK
ncbi:pyrimidine-nucleoside phosphorylase [Clostridium sp. BJN0001]|uniref:pyrimidine-nucleoside phosphorylase n=1 Tax=Clostridium sp. BJN0001 TaxID=2930219 RepID=UPI001FD1B12B|nr:pyrimidine-nucleoside phosphorylase [Clostridium sp. BJN0001]